MKVLAPGRYSDGDGLYLLVKGSGSKSWVYIFRWGKRQPEMGLGSVRDVTLQEARTLATGARMLVRSGINPIDERRRNRRQHQIVPTFGEFADELVQSISAGFRNSKHLYQWRQTLGTTYCGKIRSLRVDSITTDDVLSVLQPVWVSKPETASRLRGRLERVFDAAQAKGWRTESNPARWKGHLENLLPRPIKLSRGHHAAMPYADVPEFFENLCNLETETARALRFLILTASRVSETTQARWSEFDFDQAIWTIPGHRTKSGREHRVPLTEEVLKILQVKKPPERQPSEFIFPGAKSNRPLSNMSFAKLLLKFGHQKYTPHGFRSSFRDWAGETTSFDRETCELSLGHRIGSAVEQAYRRKDSLEKRRQLMQEWATFVCVSTQVTPCRLPACNSCI